MANTMSHEKPPFAFYLNISRIPGYNYALTKRIAGELLIGAARNCASAAVEWSLAKLVTRADPIVSGIV